MTNERTIDPDAVIDAIAKHFPDGLEHDGEEWPRVLCGALGLGPDNDDAGYAPLCDVLDGLMKAGRLRYSQAGYETKTLSWEEQARRAREAMAKLIGEPISDAELVKRLAAVLAGKVKPREA